jgi:PKD repeat protein
MKKYLLICAMLAGGIAFSCNEPETESKLKAEFTAGKLSAPVGEKILFVDQSEGDPTSWNWEFTGGDPFMSVLASPEVSWDTPGVYPVKLTVKRGGASDVIVKEDFITIEYPGVIVADFTASKTTVMQGETVKFTDASTGSPTEWKWDLLLGETIVKSSTERSPEVTFDQEGVYTVRLKASNPKTSDTRTKDKLVTVINQYAVSADFSAVSRRTIEGGTIEFTDTSLGNAETWNWQFEGGTPATSNLQNPTVTYAAAGRYKVKLTVGNSTNSDVVERLEHIAVIPAADIAFYYPLDGSAVDVGPNAINPEILKVGNGDITYNENSRGDLKAAFFVDKVALEATGGILRVPDNNKVNGSGSYTVAFWAKTSNSASNMYIFNQGRGQMDFPVHSGTNNRYAQTAFRYTTGNGIRFYLEYAGLAGNWNDWKQPEIYANGEWHHYVNVLVLENDSTQSSYTYMDGVEVPIAKSEKKVFKAIANKPYTIGACHIFTLGTPPETGDNTKGYPPFIDYSEGTEVTGGYLGFKEHFNGEMSDYVHYTRALTAAEAVALYNLTKEPVVAP